MGQFIDLTGRVFGRLRVLSRAPNKGTKPRWHCECECGGKSVSHSTSLLGGSTKSCGCLMLERTKRSNTKHGHTKGQIRSPEFRSWTQMVRRCTDPHSASYARYAGRGVTVCERWLAFENFLTDVGPRPGPGFTIDRIDNTKGYEPGNVKWSSVAEQSRNKRSSRWIEFNGERLVAADWANRLGFDRNVIYSRLSRGTTDPAELLALPRKRA
jgi:hypothetical protein